MPSRKPLLILLVGTVGSGKSTLARTLNRELGLVVVSNDRIRTSMFRCPTYSPAESASVYAEAMRELEEGVRRGCSVVYDGTNLTYGTRTQVEGRVGGVADVICVVFRTPEDVLKKRLDAREGVGASSPQPAGRKRWWDVHLELSANAEPVPPPYIVVDSTKPTRTLVRLIGRML